MAPYPRRQVVRTFSDRDDYNIWLQVVDPATPQRERGPWLTFEAVIWALGNVPITIVTDNNNWREMRMTIKVDFGLVDRGRMVADPSATAGFGQFIQFQCHLLVDYLEETCEALEQCCPLRKEKSSTGGDIVRVARKTRNGRTG